MKSLEEKRAYSKAYYAANKEKILKQQLIREKIYRSTPEYKKKRAAYLKVWVKKDKKTWNKILERKRNYRKTPVYKAWIKQYRKSNRCAFNKYKTRAKGKCLKFSLSFKQFCLIRNSPCFYCRYLDTPVGLDRKN